eukprot:11292721-Prorocentrum_lima.AAC.1
MQSEASVTLLFRVSQTGQLMSWHVPLSCPLQAIDRGTAPCIQAAMEQQLDVPILPEIYRTFPTRIDTSTADRAAANDKT